MWKLYDELIEGIPDDVLVEEYYSGRHFSILHAGKYYGVAHSFSLESRPPIVDQPPVGRTLKDVAAGIRSWNFKEATAGMAAVNAFYNSREHAKEIGLAECVDTMTWKEARQRHNPLSHPSKEVEGKKVAVIGHFPHIVKTLGGICDLYILEQNPMKGDYPASASEDLIPRMDYIYATGMTIANKTLPRLLELKRPGAVFTIVGPSGPLYPGLRRFGVDCIASYVVTEPQMVLDVIRNDSPGLFQGGKMVEYWPEAYLMRALEPNIES